MAAKCCPPGMGGPLVYVDNSGFYMNPCTGTLMQVLTWTDGPVAGVYNMCAVTQCAPAAFGPAYDPIDCPCCPVGYTWMDVYGCVNPADLKDRVDPIPCPVCPPCPTPPAPVPCVGCSTPQGEHISFTYDPTKKNCVDCKPQGEPTGLGNGADKFIPIQLLDPLINFIFRT